MTEYLDPEEIALFLFHAQQESDLMPVVEAVRDFRALPAAGRAKQVADFCATPEGQITLVKAPSARYFAKLCLSSGLLEEKAVQPANAAKKLPALRIRPDCRAYVDDLLDRRYALAEPFDFGTDLQLWMDYLGNPARDFPPIAVTLQNPAPADLLLQVTQNGRSCCGELFPAGGSCTVPMFPGEEYLAQVISPLNGAVLASHTITPDFSRRVFSLASGGLPPAPDTVAGLCAKIRALCAAKTVTPEIADYLKLLRRVFGREPKSEKALRGAYLEYYVYRLLRLRERDGVIDRLHWNGSVGQFGLPAAAPGGRDGKPDITFAIGATDFVLELTAIRSSRAQHQAEGASVPAHVIGWQEKTGRDTAGVFSAPLIYEDNSRLFQAALTTEGSPARITSITLDELLDVLATGGRRQIFDRLAGLSGM